MDRILLTGATGFTAERLRAWQTGEIAVLTQRAQRQGRLAEGHLGPRGRCRLADRGTSGRGGYRRGADYEAPRKLWELPGGLHPPPRERAPPGPTGAHDRRLRHWLLRPPGEFPRTNPPPGRRLPQHSAKPGAESRALRPGEGAPSPWARAGTSRWAFGTAGAASPRPRRADRRGAQGMSWIHRDEAKPALLAARH